ncbi:hypothetical protein J3R30DRAFT_3401562 [Lentinula aciculospora]|uniref:Uncharacterized protein n=1 Tax=Lentinula aciculospora TaxID=153920 RepID=A0A9W9ALM1_9AGAR|nr:hypothetical protein J3R30DRAFT_3401562 [Lentinula aciculospora]
MSQPIAIKRTRIGTEVRLRLDFKKSDEYLTQGAYEIWKQPECPCNRNTKWLLFDAKAVVGSFADLKAQLTNPAQSSHLEVFAKRELGIGKDGVAGRSCLQSHEHDSNSLANLLCMIIFPLRVRMRYSLDLDAMESGLYGCGESVYLVPQWSLRGIGIFLNGFTDLHIRIIHAGEMIFQILFINSALTLDLIDLSYRSHTVRSKIC